MVSVGACPQKYVGLLYLPCSYAPRKLEGASLGAQEAQALHSVNVRSLCNSPALTVSPLHSQLLGLSMATMAVVTHFGDHFTVIGRASLERNPYETLRYWGK